ncbi:hypothetical protein DFP73DRAFT_546400 [Morchella snyderi]|nr:hypothetical protein DFP73DRAFT_546400 [Morchella snyderi]
MFWPFYTFVLVLCLSLQLYAQTGGPSIFVESINPTATVYGESVGTSNQTTAWVSSTSTSTGIVLATATITGSVSEEVSRFAISDTMNSKSLIIPIEELSTSSTSEPVFNATVTPITTLETTTTIPPPAQIITETRSLLTTTTITPTASTSTPMPSPEIKTSRKFPPAIIAALSGGGGAVVLSLLGLGLFVCIRRHQVKEPEFIPEPVRSTRSPPAIVMYVERREDEGYIDIEKEDGERGWGTDAMYNGSYGRGHI